MNIDLPWAFDEKYCSYELMYNDFYETEQDFRKKRFLSVLPTELLTCSKGKTAHNESLVVPQREILCTFANRSAHGDLVPCDSNYLDYFEEWMFYESQVPFYIDSLSESKGLICDNEFECPFREDECSKDCLGNWENFYTYEKLLRCYSFLFKNLEWFSFQNKDSQAEIFYFNNSMLFHVSGVYDGFKVLQSIFVDDHSVIFVNKLKNISINLRNNPLDICTNNLVVCPWFFRCDSNKFELIEVFKVCDHHFDCTDQSDEKILFE